MSQPNILLVFTDQQQQKLMGCYGNTVVKTPCLDRLAEKSVKCTNAVVAQPVCTPARASLLTGTYGHTHGCVKNNMVLTTDIPTAAEMLKEHGYRCGYIGKWHIGNEVVPQRGFEEFYRATEDNYMSNAKRIEQGLYSGYDRFLRANGLKPQRGDAPGAFFTRMEATKLPEKFGKPAYTAMEADKFFSTLDDRPFFLAVNFLEPHPPYFSPWDGMYSKDDVSLPPNYYVNEEEKAGYSKRHLAFQRFYYEQGHNVKTSDVDDVLGTIARYYGLMSLADKYIGKILDSLESHGLADNTVVIFTSEHGDMMGSHQMVDKGMMFEEAIKIPLLVHDPRENFPLKDCEAMINNVDIVPTMLDMAGLPSPPSVEGKSFLPLLQGENADFDFAVVEWNGRMQNMHAKSGFFDDVLNAHVRCIVTRRWKLVLSPGDRSELYDLQSDPLEQRNVFDRHENEPVICDLYDKLRKWQEETNDPLEVPHPLEEKAK